MAQVTKKDTHTRRKAAVALACAVVLCVGAVLSALTSYDTATNRFSLAQGLDIRVVEEGWDSHPDADGDGVPDHAEGILPTQTVEKDPAIENLTGVQAYVFAEVSVPVRNVATANADGTLNAAADTELFSFAANEGWTLMATVPGDGEVTYRYAYESPIGRGTTPTLFDSVTYANVAGDSLAGGDLIQLVVVNAKGVQAAGFASAGEAYAELYGDPEATFVTDVTVNDPSIAAQETYEIVRLEPMSVASTSTAKIDSQVTFSDVELAEDASYAVIEQGGYVADPIVEFTVDEDMKAEAQEGGDITIGKDTRTAFAVYSADDNSLNFYKRAEIPVRNSLFEGKTVTAVYDRLGEDFGGTVPWTYFKSKIQSISVVDEGIQPTSLESWFSLTYSCTSVNVSKLDTSLVHSMKSAFYHCPITGTLDLSNWDVSSVTDMSQMFEQSIGMTDKLIGLNLSGWNVSSVTDMSRMFYFNSSLATIDLSGWNPSSITNLDSMFYGCKVLTNLDLSYWNTSKVTNMTCLFRNCSALQSIDLSGWSVSSVANMNSLFAYCEKLESIYVNNSWVLLPECDSRLVFNGCSSLIGNTGFTYDSSKISGEYATIEYYLTLKEATADASVFSINKMVKDAMIQALAA